MAGFRQSGFWRFRRRRSRAARSSRPLAFAVAIDRLIAALQNWTELLRQMQVGLEIIRNEEQDDPLAFRELTPPRRAADEDRLQE